MKFSTQNKLSLEEIRKIDPKFINTPDNELEKIKDSYYELVALALESYTDKKQSKQL